jgi:hypothetical protein
MPATPYRVRRAAASAALAPAAPGPHGAGMEHEGDAPRPATLTPADARRFADAWVAAWNAHDLDRILAHYTDDVVMASPVIVELTGEPSGTLRGTPAVRAYWATALARQPGLRFELLEVFAGAHSVVVRYRGPRGLGAETFWFGPDGRVERAAAHYAA